MAPLGIGEPLRVVLVRVDQTSALDLDPTPPPTHHFPGSHGPAASRLRQAGTRQPTLTARWIAMTVQRQCDVPLLLSLAHPEFPAEGPGPSHRKCLACAQAVQPRAIVVKGRLLVSAVLDAIDAGWPPRNTGHAARHPSRRR